MDKLGNLIQFICTGFFLVLFIITLDSCSFEKRLDPFLIFDPQTAFILEFASIEKLGIIAEQSAVLEAVSAFSITKRSQRLYTQLKNHFFPFIQSEKATEMPTFLTFQSVGAGKVAPLFVLDLYGHPSLKNSRLSEGSLNNRSSYKQQEIFSIETGAQQLSYCFLENLLLIAPHAYLIESAIRQYIEGGNDLTESSNYQKTRSWTTDKSNAKLYLYWPNLPNYYSSWLVHETSWLQSLSKKQSWSVLGLDFEKKNLYIDGVFDFSLSKMDADEATKEEAILHSILPENTASFFSVKNIRPLLYNESNKAAQQKFRQFIAPWWTGQSVYIQLETLGGNLPEEQILFLPSRSTIDTQKDFDALIEEFGELKTQEYHLFSLHQIMLANISDHPLEQALLSNKNPYGVRLKEGWCFSHSLSALKVLLDQYLVGQTLAKAQDGPFKSVNKNERPLFTIYLEPQKWFAGIQQMLVEEHREDFAPFAQLKGQLQLSGWSHKEDQQIQVTGTYAIEAAEPKVATTLIWKTQLKHIVAQSPQLIKAPTQKTLQIMVQDKAHRLYQLDRNGSILWERDLQSPILSSIYQVDYYHNGRGHLFFNTSDKVYLLDRNGQDLAHYPVELRPKARNGLLLADFTHRKEYHYFIASQNQQAYGFQINGEPLDYWNPKSGLGQLSVPIQHFQYRGSDYLLALNEGDTLHVLKQNGQARFEPLSLENSNPKSLAYQVNENGFRIVWSDHEGKIKVVNEKGASFHLNLINKKDSSFDFLFADVYGDQRKDYIGLSGLQLIGYHYAEDQFLQQLNYQFSAPQDDVFAVSLLEDDKKYLGTVNAKNQQIYLLDGRGEVPSEFPLAGTTPFVIGPLLDNQKNILIVGFQDWVYAYQLGELNQPSNQ